MKRTSYKIPRISSRGYYDLSTGKKLNSKPYRLYPKRSFEKLVGTKDLTIMIHGLRNNNTGAVTKFRIAKRRLKKLGYAYPVIGYSYDANTKGAHLRKTSLRAIRAGQRIARQNGNNLSKFIVDFKQQSPKSRIRLVGHSLGTEVIFSALQKLAKSKKKNIVESVYFFGSSLPNNIVNRVNGKTMQKAINKKIKNYYSPTDEVLSQSHKEGSVKKPLGLFGSVGKTIQKYTQKRVFPENHRFASYAAVLRSFP